jgi:membrane-associated phospholipid phosphatase
MKQRNSKMIVGGWLVLLVPALVLVVVARGAGPLPGDLAVTLALQRLLGQAGQPGILTAVVDALVWSALGLLAAWLLVARRWREAVLVVMGSLSGLAIAELVVKPLVARPRPTPDLVFVGDGRDSFGFPSSTTFLAALLLSMTIVAVTRNGGRSRLWIAVGAMVVLVIGLSRVYVGDHWVSDIIGSWLLAGVWLIPVVRFFLARSMPDSGRP